MSDTEEGGLRAQLEALLGQQRKGLDEMRRRQREFREMVTRGRTRRRRPRKTRRKDGGS